MANLSTRKKVFICNLVICFLCIVSIVSYFILPFWKVKVSYTLTAETIQELVEGATEDLGGEGSGEGNGEGNNEGEIDYTDALGSVNFADIVEDGITLELSISLETKDILSSLTADPAVLVETILMSNINTIVDTLTPTIDKIAKNLVKTVAKLVLTEQLKEQVKNNLGEAATDEQVKAELESMGLTEEYINDQVGGLVDSLYEEGTTAESAADKTIAVVEDVLNTMKESGNPDYADVELDEETKAELKDGMVELFSEFADENGNLNLEGFTTDLILGLLEGKEGDGDGDGDGDQNGEGKPAKGMAATAGATVILTNAQASDSSSADLEEEAKDLSAELKAALVELLMEAFDEKTMEMISMIVKVISYVILFTFFTWFYLILKMLVKLRMKNPAIKLKLPIWLGSIPFWILYLLPTVALMLLANPPAALANMMGAETVKTLTAVFSNLSINFFTCAWVSFIVGTFFFFFAIFYYGKLRKRLKKMKKGLIPDDSVDYGSYENYEGDNTENDVIV